ncbi:unnamed protein product [Paramecium primaurelia]|uniref:EF-hand domain-containing protein n=1 Tax=Paramecium primaurelia TaxID=5886 RepID=A0A8S1K956_PARPR|nr:unnamed protein product [Paramecium primaurelia]
MKQNCKHMMTNLRMHKHYLMFSVVQIIIDPEQNLKENMVIEVEIILTLAIMIDICIRIIAEREYFFKDNWNIIDLIAFLLILILISLYYVFELHSQLFVLQLYIDKQKQTLLKLMIQLVQFQYFYVTSYKQLELSLQLSNLIKQHKWVMSISLNLNLLIQITLNIKQVFTLMIIMNHIHLFDYSIFINYMQIYNPSISISVFRPQPTDYYHRIQSAKIENTINSNRTIPQQTISSNPDKNLAEKLFYVFDEDSSGTVDYKELKVGLEVLKDDTIDEKLKIFFDLCDEDGSGKLSEKEIFNILKQNIINENDKYQLKIVIKEMIKQVDLDGDGELNKEEILQAATKILFYVDYLDKPYLMQEELMPLYKMIQKNHFINLYLLLLISYNKKKAYILLLNKNQLIHQKIWIKFMKRVRIHKI